MSPGRMALTRIFRGHQSATDARATASEELLDPEQIATPGIPARHRTHVDGAAAVRRKVLYRLLCGQDGTKHDVEQTMEFILVDFF